MTEKGTYTDRQRVLYTWLLVALSFGLFNALYWPLHAYQQHNDPARFMEAAQRALDAGEKAAAREAVLTGIRRFQPPMPEPYALLESLMGAADPALRARTAFYAYRPTASVPASNVLREALAPLATSLELPPLPASTRAGVLTLVRTLLADDDEAQSLADNWSPEEHLALLRASGGIVSFCRDPHDAAVPASVDLLVQSTGYLSVGRHPHIIVRGQEYASRRRGFHVVLLEPESNRVLQTGLFDIWESRQEAERMETFLAEAPDGAIGLFAVHDDASANMTEELEEQLLNFGLWRMANVNRTPALFGLRYSFAAIGIKGAPEGTALQAFSPATFGEAVGHPVAIVVIASREVGL